MSLLDVPYDVAWGRWRRRSAPAPSDALGFELSLWDGDARQSASSVWLSRPKSRRRDHHVEAERIAQHRNEFVIEYWFAGCSGPMYAVSG